ncbi:MAG TPA: PIG-L family deacetylase [Pyrinomonadaceae bacterium]|nr:PIG-L family deacetylase [Pyrinomonadaceae bacterium]
MRRLFIRLIALACVVTVLTGGSFVPSSLSSVARAQVRTTYSEGAVGLGLLLRRLQTTASVLHTGAHPDDEDSALIARLARGDGARVAYLSLNRGEGGQNRIGAELSDALGIIRTEELLQARRLDGGEQFFTRAFDFGFTKTREETAARWNEREILEDMVRVIRRFRPLVVVSRWQGTQADGHGQHQFAGYLTPVALRAAADPRAFPEQLAEGLDAWQVRKFYVSHFGRAAAGTEQGTAGVVEIDTGRFDPLLGRSFYELAMEGRSQHKSQGEAALELRGAQTSRVKLIGVSSGPARPLEARIGEPERTVYDGLDTSVKGIARQVGLEDKAVADALAVIDQDAASALEKYSPHDMRPTIKSLSDGLARTRTLYGRLVEQLKTAAVLNPELVRARLDAAFLLAQKEREFRDALQLALGVRVDALADAETVTPGGSFVVAVRAFVHDSAARVQELRLRAPEGWRVERLAQPTKPETAFVARETAQHVGYFRIHAPADAKPTEPYWLSRRAGDEPRRRGDMYVWHKDDPKTEPFAPPLLTGEVEFDAGASPQVVAAAPVEYRYLDAVRGEVRRELNVVPVLSVQVDPALIIVPLDARDPKQPVTFQLVNNVQPSAERAERASASGGLGLTSPPGGWWLTATTPFKLPSEGERVTLPHTLTIPSGARAGTYRVRATASLSGDGTGRLRDAQPSQSLIFARSRHAISYPHIQTHYYYTDAEATVRVFDLQVAPVSVGYIMGSGDEVPEAIRRMGLNVTMLDETELATGDLSRFDTIVVGVRASQTRPDFVSYHARLLEFVRRGGALIVQYQRPDYAAKKLPPLPAAMEVPPARAGESPTIARVVDERAPVRVLAPEHPAFNFPNRITDADWQDWVQERSLYNFTTFDPGYTPLLASRDVGESEQTGGEVYARIGRGHYVYTSYAWFRQLPAGVPGAYRLFANLLSLPKSPGGRARE